MSTLTIRWRRRCSSRTFRSVGTVFLTELRQCEASQGAYVRPAPFSLSSTLSSVVESSTRRRWPEHNAPAAHFSTSIAQSSGRTGRGLALNQQTRVSPGDSPRKFEHRSTPVQSGFELPSVPCRTQCFLEIVRWQRSSRAVYRCDKYTWSAPRCEHGAFMRD